MPRKSNLTIKLEIEAEQAQLEMSDIGQQRATLDVQFDAARARFKFCRDLLEVSSRKRKAPGVKEN